MPVGRPAAIAVWALGFATVGAGQQPAAARISVDVAKRVAPRRASIQASNTFHIRLSKHAVGVVTLSVAF